MLGYVMLCYVMQRYKGEIKKQLSKQTSNKIKMILSILNLIQKVFNYSHMAIRSSSVKRCLSSTVNQGYSTYGKVMTGEKFDCLKRSLSTCQMKGCTFIRGLEMLMPDVTNRTKWNVRLGPVYIEVG